MQRWIWVSGCFSLMGCGEGLVGGEYPGEPLVALVGEVLHDMPIGLEVDKPAIGLFWRGKEGFLGAQSGALETHFPARYAFQIFLPPDTAVVQDLPEGGRGAMGIVMLYQDDNDDKAWSPGERVIGTGNHAVAWFEEAPPEQPWELSTYVDTTPPCEVPEQEDVIPGTIHADLYVAEDLCDVVPDMDCNPQTNDWPAVCGR